MLYIATPCSRPFNLQTISKTIPSECKWIICSDKHIEPLPDRSDIYLYCHETGFCGIKARNYILDTFPFEDNDHILFHDDDNIIHNKLYSTINTYLHNEFSIMCWGQLNKDNSIRLHPTQKPERYKIDTASYLIKWKPNKLVRHTENTYIHDGIYAERCSSNGSVLTINDYLCYYNYLAS